MTSTDLIIDRIIDLIGIAALVVVWWATIKGIMRKPK
jgi:hypothetical protein